MFDAESHLESCRVEGRHGCGLQAEAGEAGREAGAGQLAVEAGLGAEHEVEVPQRRAPRHTPAQPQLPRPAAAHGDLQILEVWHRPKSSNL